MARNRNSSKKNNTTDMVSAPLAALIVPTVTENTEAPKADRLGVDLRRARNALGLTPRQVEEVLRVKEEYLLALENGHYHLLPTTAHAKGFLRSYAQYLGLGAQVAELQTRFIAETQNLPRVPQLIMPAALPEAKLPTAKYITGGIVAAIIVALLYAGLSAPPEAENPEPAKPAASATAPAASAPVLPLPTSTSATAPAAVSTPAEAAAADTPQSAAAPVQGVIIRATDNVWVQVQDKSGATIFSRLLRKGEDVLAPAGEGLTLTAGNGAGVQLVLNGQATRAIGNKAEVVRGIALDVKKVEARLKAPVAKPAVAVPPKPLAIIAPPVTDPIPLVEPAPEPTNDE